MSTMKIKPICIKVNLTLTRVPTLKFHKEKNIIVPKGCPEMMSLKLEKSDFWEFQTKFRLIFKEWPEFGLLPKFQT